ncbi:MAG: 30S ribosomal protein S14 [Rhodobacteraceae bacterium]|mgnify:FL=1|nr:30S ribosomal protein S14 [Paracoccaceae bacterium]|tara:strand:- start:275 stop:505 length:231 start_codon:yes stop_codon:yes gene_type:complete
MTKKKHLIKDYKRRLEYKNKEILRLKYLMIKNNNILPLNVRISANDKLANLSKNSSRSKIRNRCILTGRSRGIIKE